MPALPFVLHLGRKAPRVVDNVPCSRQIEFDTANPHMAFVPNFKRPESLALPVPERDGYRIELDVPVPMRDGTSLATDLYMPAEAGTYPVLLERTPYGKHSSVMVNIGAPQNLVRNGYVVAIQDTRG